MKKNEFIEGGIQKIQGIMVSKNAPAWRAFRFISGAKSKDETRFFMSGIHIERAGGKTLLIATDGRRIHIAKIDTVQIDPGDYEVKENTRDFMILYPMDKIQFPNWRKILEGLETQKHIKIEMTASKNKEKFSRCLYQLFQATGTAINIDYLEPLGALETSWDVYFNKKIKAHTFINDNLMAIIMPMTAEKISVETVSNGPDFRDITPEPKLIEFKLGNPKAGKNREKKAV
jgi:hypothetical protein